MLSVRALAREPLLHFLVAGAALFGLHHALARGDGGAEGAARIVVDRGVRAELADAIAHRYGRPATEAEVDAAIDAWIDEEVLYREALERGLDQGDPRVRALVASTMDSVIGAALHVPEPTEAELRAAFDADPSRWAREARIDFTHVFVNGQDEAARARIDELAAQLANGASPAGLGDTFSGGRRYRGRRVEDLAEQLGPDFASGLEEQPLGTWAVRPSRFGWHVVRIDARRAGAAGDFETSRAAIEDAWRDERRRALRLERIEELRARWEIVREP